MLPDALPGSCSKGVAGCRHGGKSELTGLGITRGAALGNRTPDLRITSVVQRTRWPMVGVFERWAIPSSPSLVTAMMDGRGHNGATGGRTSDVNDADVVCIRAIESEKASP
jgi:hypothetical protein